MRVRNSITGKYETLRVGQAVCGKRFSEITFLTSDYQNFTGSEMNTAKTMAWIQHLLTTRLDINKCKTKNKN